jgi:hypothetical protein
LAAGKSAILLPKRLLPIDDAKQNRLAAASALQEAEKRSTKSGSNGTRISPRKEVIFFSFFSS